MKRLITKHQLDFEAFPWYRDNDMTAFKVGTCEGLYQTTQSSYQIVAVTNDEKGNGHLGDVFEWFDNSCKRDKKDLEVVAIMNPRFMVHLMNRRGFIRNGPDSVIKKLEYIQ